MAKRNNAKIGIVVAVFLIMEIIVGLFFVLYVFHTCWKAWIIVVFIQKLVAHDPQRVNIALDKFYFNTCFIFLKILMIPSYFKLKYLKKQLQID